TPPRRPSPRPLAPEAAGRAPSRCASRCASTGWTGGWTTRRWPAPARSSGKKRRPPPPGALVGDHPAGDVDRLAGHVPRIGGAEERHDARHIVRLPESAERGVLE